MRHRWLTSFRALLPGILVGVTSIACEDPNAPTLLVDGILAFSDADGIHVFDLSSRTDTIIYSPDAGTEIRGLTWAPGGTSLVFPTYAFGQSTQFIREWKMYGIAPDGSDMSLMFDRVGPETHPAFGPDGRLAYWGTEGLYINGWATYTSAAAVGQSPPTWSPDGLFITFASANILLRVSLEDTSETQVLLGDSEGYFTVRDPATSPDGTQIAFVRELTTSLSEIRIVNVDGTGERVLTTEHADRCPAWSRDGAYIAFVRDEARINIVETGPEGRIQTLFGYPAKHIAWTW